MHAWNIHMTRTEETSAPAHSGNQGDFLAAASQQYRVWMNRDLGAEVWIRVLAR